MASSSNPVNETEFHALWRMLGAGTPTQGAQDYALRLVASRGTVRVFAAIERASGKIAVVADCPKFLAPYRLAKHHLRRLSIEVGAVSDMPPDRVAVAVVLRDKEFEGLFADLAAHLIRAFSLGRTDEEAVEALVHTLEKWRRFFESDRPPLGEIAVRGLIGELAVLERLTVAIGISPAVLAWRDGVRDFELPGCSIEVKTFAPSEGASVRISDALQLIPDQDSELFLVAQELSKSNDPEATLPKHVERVLSLIRDDLQAVDHFREILFKRGYETVHATAYVDGFAVGRLRCFKVVSGFPRIELDAIPSGVRDVAFSLVVSDLTPFEVEPHAIFRKSNGGSS